MNFPQTPTPINFAIICLWLLLPAALLAWCRIFQLRYRDDKQKVNRWREKEEAERLPHALRPEYLARPNSEMEVEK